MKTLFSSLKTILVLLVAVVSIASVQAAFGPTATPPNNNVEKPILLFDTTKQDIRVKPGGDSSAGGLWAVSVGVDGGYCLGAGPCIDSWLDKDRGTYTWVYPFGNTFGACVPSFAGATCSGTQYKHIACERNDGLRFSDSSCGTPPAQYNSCTLSTCTYSWQVEDFRDYECVNGTATRPPATCENSEGETVSDSLCTSTRPSQTRSCSAGGPGSGGNNPVPPSISFSAGSASVAYGGSTNLIWSTSNATSCGASNGWVGTKETSGSESTGALTATRTYTLTCTGNGGTSASSVTVTVAAAPIPAPTVSISADSTFLITGGSTTIRWSSTNATSCTATRNIAGGTWTGTKGTSGFEGTGTLTARNRTQNYTYTLTCTGSGGTTGQGSVTVSVEGSS